MPASLERITNDLHTVLDFLRFGLSCAGRHELYYGHGTDNAEDDIYSLILGALSLPLNVDAALFHARLTADEKKRLTQLLERRIYQRVPVPYLTHKAYFCGLEFFVDERVLIPRSPLAEFIQNQCSPWVHEEKVRRVLDLCTGSGCIAIACCYAFPNAQVDAVDISKEALEVASINQKQHGVEDILHLIQSDCFDKLPKEHYDLIISNPPYVGHDEMKTLPPEYHHEPVIALEASSHGLTIVNTILHTASDYLSDDGVLVVEVGNSEQALVDAYPNVPFVWLEFEHGGQGVFVLTKKQLKEYFLNS